MYLLLNQNITNNQNGIILPVEGMEVIKILENKSLINEIIQQMAVDIETHSPLSYCRKILDL